MEEVDDEGERELVGVLDASREAMVGGVEGELRNLDGGGGGELASDELSVERGGEDGDGEVGSGSGLSSGLEAVG